MSCVVVTTSFSVVVVVTVTVMNPSALDRTGTIVINCALGPVLVVAIVPSVIVVSAVGLLFLDVVSRTATV